MNMGSIYTFKNEPGISDLIEYWYYLNREPVKLDDIFICISEPDKWKCRNLLNQCGYKIRMHICYDDMMVEVK